MALSVTTQPDAALFCINTVQALDENPAAPANVMKRTAFLDRLLASDNAEGWEIDQYPGKNAPGNGASKLTLRYLKPMCAGGSSAPATNICEVTGSYEDEYGYLEMNLDKVAERHFTVDLADFINLCESPNPKIARLMRRKAYEIRQEINIETIKAAYAAAGNYQNGDLSTGAKARSLTVINTQGEIIPAGFVPIHMEYQQAGFQGDKFIVGGETLGKYFFTNMYGTNPNNPAQFENLDALPFIYDPAFDTQFQALASDSDSHGLSVPVGGMHFQEWFLNTGDQKLTLEDRVSTTMEIDGMEYDVDIYLDKCDKVWKVQLKKIYGVGHIPDAAYCDGNGLITHWLFKCGDFACDNGAPVEEGV